MLCTHTARERPRGIGGGRGGGPGATGGGDEAKGFEEYKIDWDFAHEELMAKQGIDLKAEMAKKLKEIEEQFLKEKEEANQAFQQERKVNVPR